MRFMPKNMSVESNYSAPLISLSYIELTFYRIDK